MEQRSQPTKISVKEDLKWRDEQIKARIGDDNGVKDDLDFALRIENWNFIESQQNQQLHKKFPEKCQKRIHGGFLGDVVIRGIIDVAANGVSEGFSSARYSAQFLESLDFRFNRWHDLDSIEVIQGSIV